ncbi:MAG: restriction endonuclease subunit S [Methanosarcina sp.]|nr:restriction endonuclease subunit S [Methanosarcina sp.]MDD4620912.1 restriction endonuclease subunit S [Methanosarcina sp.]
MSAECSAGNIPPGYKQTEVGVIPEDWEVKLLGDLFDFSGGLSASRDQLSMEGYCYLHYGDIHTSNRTFIDVRSEQQEIPKLDIPLKKASSTSLLEDGDVVFVDASEDDEGTSRHVVIINKDKIPFISGLHTIVAKSKTGELDHQYRRYCFQTVDIKRQFRFFAVGTKVSGISKTNIARITLPVPPVPEQEAIAEALSDADAFIESLEQLISKKRQIKQGAMQELLTGKRRLPGFSGEWKMKRLGDLASIQRGASPRPIDSPVWFDDNSSVGWVRISDVTRTGMFLRETTQRLSSLGVQHSRPVSSGSLIMSICATVGRPVITEIDTCIHDGFVVFDGFRVDKRLLYYSLKSIEDNWSRHGQTGSQMNLNTGLINQTTIAIPPTHEEQEAIANILSDMDSEITVLEEKLAKARQLKQGMMQELLTGRIRLL